MCVLVAYAFRPRWTTTTTTSPRQRPAARLVGRTSGGAVVCHRRRPPPAPCSPSSSRKRHHRRWAKAPRCWPLTTLSTCSTSASWCVRRARNSYGRCTRDTENRTARSVSFIIFISSSHLCTAIVPSTYRFSRDFPVRPSNLNYCRGHNEWRTIATNRYPFLEIIDV